MHTPTKAQWQTVIDNFYKILPLALDSGECHLDMSEPGVNIYHECGTVHCVGGWYAIATMDTGKDRVDFLDGVEQITTDLGFTKYDSRLFNKKALESWAMNNTEIWGNPYGQKMFYDSCAYGEGARSIIDIINHLEGVRDRSPE